MKVFCVVAALLAVAHASNSPPCFAMQTQYNFNFQEFHDVSRRLEDVVVSRAQVYTDYTKNVTAIYGDFIQGGTSFIGAIYVTPMKEYIWIHGSCNAVSQNATFQRCLGLSPFRNTTVANLPAAVYRLTQPSGGSQTQNSAWYWFTNPQQPFAWQSYFTATDGTEVGTQSYIIDGYLPRITDPTKLNIPANCLQAEASEVINPRHAKLTSILRSLVGISHKQ